MPDGTDDHLVGVTNLEKHDIARTSEWSDQLLQKSAMTGLATTEGAVGQRLAGLPNRLDDLRCEVEVAGGSGQPSLKQVVEQAFQIFSRLGAVDHPVDRSWRASFALADTEGP